MFSLSGLAQTCPVNVSVATSPVYKITVTPLTPNAVTPITVTVSTAQNVAVTISPNILAPEVDPRLPAPGASGNVCTSDGSKWISAASAPGGITGPTDSTLTKTGTTLGLNLNNENVWTGAQVFNGGLSGYVNGTGLVPNAPYVDLGAYGSPFDHGYFNGLVFNSSVTGKHETTLQQSATLDYGVHNVLELPNASGTLALTSDVIPYVTPGTPGNVLTSNGTAWKSAALPSETDPVFTAWKATTPPLYAESDTLASVTARGATTSVASSFTGGLSASTVSAGSLNVQTPTTSTVGAIIKGASGQTADLLQVQDSTGAKLVTVTKDGRLAVGGASPTPYDFQGAGHGIHLNGGPIYGFSSLNSGSVNPSYLYGLQDVGWDDTIPYDILKLRKWKAGGSTQNYISAYLNGGSNGADGANIFNLNYQGILSFANTGALAFSSTSSAVDALDVGITRASAGVLNVTNGATGDGTITAKSFRLKGYTVATLPAGTQGDTAYVTDAVAPTYLGVVTGGGTVVTPVFYNGTAWVAY
jgi:hypothetical protein